MSLTPPSGRFQTIHRLTVSPLSLSASGVPENIPHRFMRPRFRIKHQSGKKTGRAVFSVMVRHARWELNHALVAWPRYRPSLVAFHYPNLPFFWWSELLLHSNLAGSVSHPGVGFHAASLPPPLAIYTVANIPQHSRNCVSC